MQLSAASPSLEINSAAPASAAASADRAALAASAVGTDGESGDGDFAALVSHFSAPSAAPSESGSATGTGQKPGSRKPGLAPWSGGPRRAGFVGGRPSARSAAKASDASDPLALLALAGVLPVSPAQADPALPTLELSEGLPSSASPEAAGAFDFAGGQGPGADQALRPASGFGSAAIPAGLAAADVAPMASPASGENSPDKAGPAARAESGPRLAPFAASAGTVAGQGEKIAEAGAPFEREGGASERGPEKKIQNTSDKRLADARVSFGTDVAKPAPVMSTTSLPRPTSSDAASAAVSSAAATQDRLPPAPESAAVTASQAHRAVEAVMTAADRVGAGEKQAVNLQFSFLDVSLAVRVELREGAVHTTFRTDSTELRSALAHEWQAVSPQISDRPIKMADPVFAADHGGSGANSFTGEHARQQQQQRDASARGNLGFLSSAPARAASRASAAAADVAAPVGFTRRSTTTHLETFA